MGELLHVACSGQGSPGQGTAHWPILFLLLLFVCLFFVFCFCFVLFELQLVRSQRDLALVDLKIQPFSAFIYRVQFMWILLILPSSHRVISREIFWIFCRGMIGLGFFPLKTATSLSSPSTRSHNSWFSSVRAASVMFSQFKAISSGHNTMEAANCDSQVVSTFLLRLLRYSARQAGDSWTFPPSRRGPHFSTIQAIPWYKDPRNPRMCPGKTSLIGLVFPHPNHPMIFFKNDMVIILWGL